MLPPFQWQSCRNLSPEQTPATPAPPVQKLPFRGCRFQFSLHFEPRSEHGGLCQTGVLVASAKDGEGRPGGRERCQL